jgi:hypothetical protein
MNANLPKPETLPNAPTEERLAKLTGFNNPSPLPTDSSEPSTSSVTASPLLSDEDVEEQITRHSFASSPLSSLPACFCLNFNLRGSQFQPQNLTRSRKVNGVPYSLQISPIGRKGNCFPNWPCENSKNALETWNPKKCKNPI